MFRKTSLNKAEIIWCSNSNSHTNYIFKVISNILCLLKWVFLIKLRDSHTSNNVLMRELSLVWIIMDLIIQWLYKNLNTCVLMIEQINSLSLKLKVKESNPRRSKSKKRKIENTCSLCCTQIVTLGPTIMTSTMVKWINPTNKRKKSNLVAMIWISDIVTNKKLKRRELSCWCSSHSFFPRWNI